MITGYDELNNKIKQTKHMIDMVSSASIEQSKAIAQINDTIINIDKQTRHNAKEASVMLQLSNNVKALSDNLMSVTKYVEFREEAKQRVCDIGLSLHINKLKLGHIQFKDNHWNNLDAHTNVYVDDHTQCQLGQWIVQMEEKGYPFTKTSNWQEMKKEHQKVHEGIKNFIDINKDNADSLVLIPKAYKVEESISKVFNALNKVKQDNCEGAKNE
jgi:methyl-accepting chemotaxis protein